VLHAGVTEGIKAVPALLGLAQDPRIPAVVRATAAALAGPGMRPEFFAEARTLLQDADPSVRMAALGLAEGFDSTLRARTAGPLLSDPILGVRMEAARIVADVPDGQLTPAQLAAREKATREYREALALNADWPSENVNEGNFLLRQGRMDAAMAAFRRALELDPLLIGAYVNLADLYRQQGRDGEGEKLLREGLIRLPNAADLRHALGLLRVRQGRTAAALQELMAAAALAPENPRYAYVYAVALHSSGQLREALAALKEAEARHPYDLDLLGALIAMLREAGEDKSALDYARKAVAALPDDENIKRLVQELTEKE
jgi:tetratricopeptide (TPR) repeat protein